MQLTLTELRETVREMLSEAKKKKEKVEKDGALVGRSTHAYGSYDEAFDFSTPLGISNLYKSQGASNLGPYTGPSLEKVNDHVHGQGDPRAMQEEMIREFVRSVITEDSASAWDSLSESTLPRVDPKNIWESALHWYDFQERGLGGTLDEKFIGFKKLSGKLAHKKGVKDPKALAASIGRKKYGAAGMAKKAAAGKK